MIGRAAQLATSAGSTTSTAILASPCASATPSSEPLRCTTQRLQVADYTPAVNQKILGRNALRVLLDASQLHFNLSVCFPSKTVHHHVGLGLIHVSNTHSGSAAITSGSSQAIPMAALCAATVF